jgi:hypothetical protein
MSSGRLALDPGHPKRSAWYYTDISDCRYNWAQSEWFWVDGKKERCPWGESFGVGCFGPFGEDKNDNYWCHSERVHDMQQRWAKGSAKAYHDVRGAGSGHRGAVVRASRTPSRGVEDNPMSRCSSGSCRGREKWWYRPWGRVDAAYLDERQLIRRLKDPSWAHAGVVRRVVAWPKGVLEFVTHWQPEKPEPRSRG